MTKKEEKKKVQYYVRNINIAYLRREKSHFKRWSGPDLSKLSKLVVQTLNLVKKRPGWPDFHPKKYNQENEQSY